MLCFNGIGLGRLCSLFTKTKGFFLNFPRMVKEFGSVVFLGPTSDDQTDYVHKENDRFTRNYNEIREVQFSGRIYLWASGLT